MKPRRIVAYALAAFATCFSASQTSAQDSKHRHTLPVEPPLARLLKATEVSELYAAKDGSQIIIVKKKPGGDAKWWAVAQELHFKPFGGPTPEDSKLVFFLQPGSIYPRHQLIEAPLNGSLSGSIFVDADDGQKEYKIEFGDQSVNVVCPALTGKSSLKYMRTTDGLEKLQSMWADGNLPPSFNYPDYAAYTGFVMRDTDGAFYVQTSVWPDKSYLHKFVSGIQQDVDQINYTRDLTKPVVSKFGTLSLASHYPKGDQIIWNSVYNLTPPGGKPIKLEYVNRYHPSASVVEEFKYVTPAGKQLIILGREDRPADIARIGPCTPEGGPLRKQWSAERRP